MSVHLVLTVTGMVGVALAGGGIGYPEIADLELLVVDTGSSAHGGHSVAAHRALLTFEAKDYVDGPLANQSVAVGVGSGAVETAGIDLGTSPRWALRTREEPAPEANELFAEWAHEKDGKLVLPTPEGALDWLLPLKTMGIEVDPQLQRGVASRIRFSGFRGRLASDGLVPQIAKPSRTEVWYWEKVPGAEQPIANRLAIEVELPNDELWITDAKGETHHLRPFGDETLRIAISNLPGTGVLAEAQDAASPTHLGFFARLHKADLPSSSAFLPMRKSVQQTIKGGICPPGFVVMDELPKE